MSDASAFPVCPWPKKLETELARLESSLNEDGSPTSTYLTDIHEDADGSTSSGGGRIDLCFGHYPEERSWRGPYREQAVILQVEPGETARKVADRLASKDDLVLPSFNFRVTRKDLAEIIRSQNSEARTDWPPSAKSGPSQWSSPWSIHKGYSEEHETYLTADRRLGVTSDRGSVYGPHNNIQVAIAKREGGWIGAFNEHVG